MARIEPLPREHSPDLKEQFALMEKNLGFIPNSVLIMQRRPKMAKALAQMTASIWDPEGLVDRGLKRLIAHVASRDLDLNSKARKAKNSRNSAIVALN